MTCIHNFSISYKCTCIYISKLSLSSIIYLRWMKASNYIVTDWVPLCLSGAAGQVKPHEFFYDVLDHSCRLCNKYIARLHLHMTWICRRWLLTQTGCSRIDNLSCKHRRTLDSWFHFLVIIHRAWRWQLHYQAVHVQAYELNRQV